MQPNEDLRLPQQTPLLFADVLGQISWLKRLALPKRETAIYRFIQTFEPNPARQLELFNSSQKV